MTELPDWFTRPPLDTEKTFDLFVTEFGGTRVADLISGVPTFDNADYLFGEHNVLAELKSLKTDFGRTPRFSRQYLELTAKYVRDGKMNFGSIWRPAERPREFTADFVRLFRPPLERILKKANSQIKDTRANLSHKNAQGVLLLVNDEFLSLEPRYIISIICNKLVHSYSAIDAFVYITLNHYVDIPGSDYARLLWVPSYSVRATEGLPQFIDDLGSRWFKFLDGKIGPFDISQKTDDRTILLEGRAIPPPRKRP